MEVKEKIVHDKGLDHTLGLMGEGYLFIKNRMDFYKCNIFETHIMGEKAICISGEEACKLFYDEELFQRKGAMPMRVQKTLLGVNAIQGMDQNAHIQRKLFFMSLMTEAHQKKFAEIFLKEMEASVTKWESMNEIVLFHEAKNILCKAVCFWTGVPLPESEVENRADDLSSMIDGFGGVGPRYWKGKSARNRTEEWIRGIIEDVRNGKLIVNEDSALYLMAFHREPDGIQMDLQMAAIELINIIRPIVAISTYITFTALALYEHPECREELMRGDNNYSEMFVQEVRRYYPFTPFIGARVRKDFVWNEYEFKTGVLVLLDVYGMNHDSKIWNDPGEFKPERFQEQKDRTFSFIPQGGGDPGKGHRCPGEGITIEIMKASLNFLINNVDFEVPEQDLSYSLSRIPTLPESGFIMKNMKKKF
ncbi:cytochrome P450 [Clostridium sp. Marseille-P2415]|uniref:cytochrome P450 n=1 Tax=Clostridium sp. Marseille-P2415 TaxID=1805471 RepID=UPI00098834CB|nr:cytochrome P450 [Clostridium sp. Marseille-P2415]